MTIPSVGEDVEHLGLPYNADENLSEKLMVISTKGKNTHKPHDPPIPYFQV